MICQRIEKYSFHPEQPGRCGVPGSFTFSLTADFSRITQDCTLAELPGIFTFVRRKVHGTGRQSDYLYYAWDLQNESDFDDAQHYDAYPMPDGCAYAIEAKVMVSSPDHPDWTEVRAGVSQSRIPAGKHTLTLHCDGIAMLLLLDGIVLDESFLYGGVKLPPEHGLPENFYSPALLPEIKESYADRNTGIQYFSPFADNAWVGDVVPFVHEGTVHIFYLLDRRHHGNKFGTGAHYYGHLSSTDLKHWTEHPTVGRPEAQWETCGTGTPFYHNGMFYFAYGLHTDRYVPYEKNAGQLLREEAERNGGCVTPVPFAELGERLPEGMTYAVSADCIHFRKSGMLTNFSENPSVYVMPDNTLKMYADGIWTAESIDRVWMCRNTGFPPSGKDSALRNTLECPSFFEWNGSYYLIVGMDGFYRSETAEFTEYTDLAAEGRDIYDGLVVPMVIPWQKGRRLIAGWIFPFGSFLVLRELVQFPDHDLGTKWCPELMPDTWCNTAAPEPDALRAGVPVPQGDQDTVYSFTLDGSRGGKFAVQIASDKETIEFQLDLDECSAQIETVSAPGEWFMPPLPTMRERVAEWIGKADIASFKEMPSEVKFKCHVFSRDFRLDHLRGLDGYFTVRLRLWRDSKMPSALLDAEIAEMRTMISFRPHFSPEYLSVRICGGTEILSAEVKSR